MHVRTMSQPEYRHENGEASTLAGNHSYYKRKLPHNIHFFDLSRESHNCFEQLESRLGCGFGNYHTMLLHQQDLIL